MRRDEQTLSEKLDGVVRKLTAVRLAFDMKGTNNVTMLRAINTISTLKNQIAALSIEQTEPVGEQWCAFEDGHQHTSWYPDGYGDRAGWQALAKRNPAKYQIVTRPLYAHPTVSALVNAQADADVVERWQPIETAPRDGTPVDLWGVNHLHPRKTGRRATDVTWGRVRDWLGNERDDWQHGQSEDFEPTHWMPRPAPPALSSLRPAEVGSATSSSGTGGGE